MQNARIFQFVHIEKTAGTSIRFAVEQAMGKDSVAIYSPEAHRLTLSSDDLMPATTPVLDWMRMEMANPVTGALLVNLYPMVSGVYRERIRRMYPEFIVPEGAKIVFGHFSANTFQGMIENPIRAVVIRDPFDRMVSHFKHWKKNRSFEDWRLHIPFRRGMEFKEFALLPMLRNYQLQALDGLSLTEFEIVGVTEKTNDFTEALLQRIAAEGYILSGQKSGFAQKRLNTTPEKRKTIGYDESDVRGDEVFMERFRTVHAQDYTLYEQAVQLSQGNDFRQGEFGSGWGI